MFTFTEYSYILIYIICVCVFSLRISNINHPFISQNLPQEHRDSKLRHQALRSAQQEASEAQESLRSYDMKHKVELEEAGYPIGFMYGLICLHLVELFNGKCW